MYVYPVKSHSDCSFTPVGGESKQTGILVIGNKSIDISATTEHIAKQMTPLNSVHQIGLHNPWNRVLTVVWGLSTEIKTIGNSGNGVRIHQYLRNQWRYHKTDDAIEFLALNRSIHIVELRSNCSFRHIVGKSTQSAISGMGCESINISTTSTAVAKWTAPFDSAH